MVYGLQFYSKKLLVVFASCVTMGIEITPQYTQQHFHRVYRLSSLAYNSYICTSMCMQAWFGMYITDMYITDMHTCLSQCIHQCSAQELLLHQFCMHMHAYYESEIKNVSCQAYDACMFSQVYIKLYCIIYRRKQTKNHQ